LHIPAQGSRIHGIIDEIVAGMPTFPEKADVFLGFVGDSNVIAHNAKFDMRFLNAELAASDREEIEPDRVVDTLKLARDIHPNEANTLDALSERYHIRGRDDQPHGALTDSIILADLYPHLAGGEKTGRHRIMGSGVRQDGEAGVEKRKPW
jgi:DNA polymerase III subunit epsilon